MEQEQHFIDYIEQSIIRNWNLNALTDYKGATLQYKDVARKIAKFHIVLESAGIQPGDKIAVCGRNSAHWAVTFLATITYGAVIVPILHEFKADNIHNIVNHSEARLLFVGDQVWENLNEDAMPQLLGVILMTEFTPVVCRDKRLMEAFEHRNTLYGQRYPKNFRPEHICYRKDEPEELAIINYTSGTTGYSKGVMLPYRSLWSNVNYCHEMLPVKPGDNMVAMLPMGHVFGMTYDFLYGFSAGAHLYFLTRMPTPKIIAQSFAEIKPDPDLPKSKAVTTQDYKGSGWDRGHLCPAGDNKWDREAMIESFYMTNICPQHHNLNRGDWNELEQKCRKWVKKDSCLYIVAGPIFYDRKPQTIGEHKVAVPDAFFKVILSLHKRPKAIGFIYKNNEGNNPLDSYVNTVDEVERITGIDFFPALPDDIERAVEASYNLKDWK